MLNHQLVVTDERSISSIFFEVPPQRIFTIIMYSILIIIMKILKNGLWFEETLKIKLIRDFTKRRWKYFIPDK